MHDDPLVLQAQFMDVYLSTAVLIGIASIAADLDMTIAESVWMLNAYACTLAAGLLTAGRLSDIWKPKWVFIIGFAFVGATSLGSAFVQDKIAMFILRAFTGIGASLTIPSAIALIVRLFPEEKEQSMAIAVFGGSGAIANVLGFVLGGVLLLSSWRAIWYL
jgi:MFS family permease